MISPEKALEIILKKTRSKERVDVDVGEALGHVLTGDLRSTINVPIFDNSAMDGFAVHETDLSNKNPLIVIGEVKAGQGESKQVNKGSVVSIMTGAAIPKGASAVVPIEDVDVADNTIVLNGRLKKGANIRRAGEDIEKGTVLISANTHLKPIHIGLAASVGKDKLKVYSKPSVALITTGDEIKKPGTKLKPGQIYDSNSFLLKSLLKKLGINLVFVSKAKDDLKNTERALKEALDKADVVLTTGGISVGKYDFLAEALKNVGAKCHFDSVKQKPGKPLSFSTYKDKMIVSLPGNPVAVAVNYELYVRPMLLKMSGSQHFFRKEIKAVLSADFKKKKGRTNWVRVWLSKKGDKIFAKPTGAQGSGVLSSMQSDGLVCFEADKDFFKKGQSVRVIDFDEDYK